MEYNDSKIPTLEDYEKLAKAYAESLKDKGFVFIRLDNENYNFLLDEVFDILFKLRATYRFLGTFLEANQFLELTNGHIEKLRNLFDYKKNRGFRIRGDRTKAFLNSVSLENRLIIKLNSLAQKSDFFNELSQLCLERLHMSAENYKIEGLLNIDDKFIR